MSAIRNDVLRAIAHRKHNPGDKFRLRHEVRDNGSICTDRNKDAAMNVTRLSNGWAYICHRCGESGFISNNSISPAVSSERIKQILEMSKLTVSSVVKKISLPYDFKSMAQESEQDIEHGVLGVPWAAYHWVWKYSLRSEDIVRWNIGWSEAYKRVILPIYEYSDTHNSPDKDLVGWVGREIAFKTKEERVRNKVSKYITKKQSDKGRVFFTCPSNSENNRVILTEDIISAIKVWNSLGGRVETVALLTTSVDNDLILSLKGKDVFLWLDGDMIRKSVKIVSKMRDLGLSAFYMYTPKDPKDYNEVFISEMWNSRKG